MVKFVADGGNVFAATGNSVSSTWRNFAAECGVHVAPAGHVVVDHASYDGGDGGQHTRVLSTSTPNPSAAGWVTGALEAPFVFEGVGLSVDPDNYLTFSVVSAGPTGLSLPLGKSFSGQPLAGHSVGLLVASQGRNNARVTFLGSTWALSNEALLGQATPLGGAAGPSSNAQVAANALAWTFQARGVLRASNIWHQHAAGTPPAHQLTDKEKSTLPRSMYPEPEAAPRSLVYRIKEEVQYFVDLHVWDGEVWAPIEVDDAQLEFVMLDPYIRQGLEYQGNGTYKAQFLTPDSYGVFKFRFLYRRHGLSTVFENRQVTVRRFWHNEYERYIPAAAPYYLAVFTMMAGFFVFSAVFLSVKPGVPFAAGPGARKAKKD